MRKAVAFLSLSFLCAPLIAADSAPAPKTRTLAELAAFTLKSGRDHTMKAVNAKAIGLPDQDAVAKAVRYTSNQTADHSEHVLHAVYYKTDSGELKPSVLIWSVTKSSRKPDGKYIDAINFRVSLDGQLLGAATVVGKVGELDQQIMPIDSSPIKERFKNELDFWTKESVPLKIDTGTK